MENRNITFTPILLALGLLAFSQMDQRSLYSVGIYAVRFCSTAVVGFGAHAGFPVFL